VSAGQPVNAGVNSSAPETTSGSENQVFAEHGSRAGEDFARFLEQIAFYRNRFSLSEIRDFNAKSDAGYFQLNATRSKTRKGR